MDTSVKVVVVGDGAVGKTCMLYCYANNQFPEEYMPTVFDNYNANTLYENRTVSLGLWDTAGQEDYDSLRPLSYSETDVFLVCFSMISKTSLNNVREKWIPEIKEHCKKETPMILIGLKKDLLNDPKTIRIVKESGDSMVDGKEGADMAKQTGCITYCECSAKTREGLDDVFINAIASVLNPGKFQEKNPKKDNTGRKKKFCLIL